jgi:hypothetical protein
MEGRGVVSHFFPYNNGRDGARPAKNTEIVRERRFLTTA